MNLFQRIKNLIGGLIQLAMGVALVVYFQNKYTFVLFILGLALTIRGIKLLLHILGRGVERIYLCL